jgi:myo-inositol-1(or 4)-monophosphatase
MPLAARYVAAQHIARRAGQLAHDLFVNRKALANDDRPAQEYVAHGDRAISAMIVSKLSGAFTADAFVDHDRSTGIAPERLWAIQGIVGERNFRHDIPFYAISIAYAQRGRCETAIIYDPERDEMFHALRDQGAWCQRGGHEERLGVTRCTALDHALISVALDERPQGPMALDVRRELIGAGAVARSFGAPALELAHVAAGRFDGFVGSGIDPLRVMGALLLVEEAGGYVSHLPAAGGISNDLPIVGCAPALARPLNAINAACHAEVAVEPTPEMRASVQGRARGTLAHRRFS